MKLKLAQSVLKPFGYQLVRYSRFEEMLRKLRACRDTFTFVQIGANDGIMFDNLYYFVTEQHLSPRNAARQLSLACVRRSARFGALAARGR